MITRAAAVAPAPVADRPAWLEFLGGVTGGDAQAPNRFHFRRRYARAREGRPAAALLPPSVVKTRVSQITTLLRGYARNRAKSVTYGESQILNSRAFTDT
jgi:hypothetical protein